MKGIVATLLLAALVAAVASSARAQDPNQTVTDAQSQADGILADPGPACAEQTEVANQGTVGCDNKYTPIAKEGNGIGWSQWAGAVHPEAEKPSGYDTTVQNQLAPIPPTVDFYTVSFANTSRGFAGGARCREDPPDELLEEDLSEEQRQELARFLNECVRVPVIYRYTDFTENGPFWEQAYRGTTPGYVGAITWLHNLGTAEHGQRALAIGGDASPSAACPKSQTGCPGYPRREPPIPDDVADDCRQKAIETLDAGNPVGAVANTVNGVPQAALRNCESQWRQEHDPAGMGRAWLYSEEDWDEKDVPGEMRGMTALDASLRPDDCAGSTTNECAMAGGLQQIWMWQDGRFDPVPWEPWGAAERADRAVGVGFNAGFDFRVRAIRFRPALPLTNSSFAQAVTSGCCSSSPDPRVAGGRIMEYRGTTWRTSGPQPPKRLPDSLYALTFGPDGNTTSYLATPGGPQRDSEPPSRIIRGDGIVEGNRILDDFPGSAGILTGTETDLPNDAARHWRSPARLVAGDGDAQGHQLALRHRLGKATAVPLLSGPDAFMDWAVGGLKGTQRAAAYTTTTQIWTTAGVDGVFPIKCPGEFLDGSKEITPEGVTESAPGCTPDERAAEQTKSNYLFSLSSYFLNGFTLAGASGGWGVGDRGAIERWAGNGSDGAAGGTLRPEHAPKLGSRSPSAAPPRRPYEATEPPLGGEPGTVPALASLAEQQLPEPRLTPYGSPNPHVSNVCCADSGESVRQIVMSRDGSEGWAIGPFYPSGSIPITLYHFDGTRWRRCGTDSVEGVLAADPACEALWPLRHSGPSATVGLRTIARIPLEYGDDPTRADDFEAIAVSDAKDGVGSNGGRPGHLMLRYHDGRWSFDAAATKQLAGASEINDIAFSSPDDGWLVNRDVFGLHIYRFDGEGWAPCAPCDDHAGLIPASGWHLTSAGQRLYLYGNRRPANATGAYPFVLYKDPGQDWKQAYDPGCVRQEPDCVPVTAKSAQGYLASLSVAQGPDGSYNGWGVGSFGADGPGADGAWGGAPIRVEKGAGETPFIHAQPNGTSWALSPADDVANDYLLRSKITHATPGFQTGSKVVALPGREGRGAAVATAGVRSPGGSADVPPVWFDPDPDPAREGWRVLSTPYGQVRGSGHEGHVGAIAPDNAGGLWFVAGPLFGEDESIFYRFSDHAPPDVFEEVAHPIREQVTAAAGGGDGSFWVATDQNVVYRYDRQTGWERMAIPGWDPGRVVTSPSPAYAIAIGADGNGVVVGKSGRIADLGPGGVVLDAAAGVLCSAQEAPAPPCGSGRDLRAASVAPDGSAMVGGESRALLYRQGGTGQFHAVTPPPTAVYATITGISMPAPDRAWVVTNLGQIYAGTLEGADWGWAQEDTDRFGESITRDERRKQWPLRAIAIDASGHGYAVGERGTIVERTGAGTPPWRRVDAGYLDDLSAVTLGPGGKGALIGGEAGQILTEAAGQLEPARPWHVFDRTTGYGHLGVSRMAGLALLPGYQDGQLEAWAASQPPFADPRGVLFHYSSDLAEPLLGGGAGRTAPLPDADTPSPDQLSFAAFGNSNCQGGGGARAMCPELTGTNHANDVIARGIREEIAGASSRPGGPDFALFTGDVGNAAGTTQPGILQAPLDDSPVHERWSELIAGPLREASVPVFGAIGGRDLSRTAACDPRGAPCFGTESSQSRLGANLAWRTSMAAMPAPWGAPGASPASSAAGLSFSPVSIDGVKAEPGDTAVSDPTKAASDQTVETPFLGDVKTSQSGLVGDQTIPTGGARTHYAVDIERDGEKLARLVVLDTSLKSLAASNPIQNPSEEQLSWLQEVLASRPAGERAIVLTNTPTYAYGTSGALTDTDAAEATQLETIFLQNKVDAVVQGRLGWNALYYLRSSNGVPVDHVPGPGGSYPQSPPDPLPGGRALPFVIASSAGGRFGPTGGDSGSASDGYWHGYTVVRLDLSKEPETPGAVRVEQRPVFDWIGITVPPGAKTKATHVLRPNQKLDLDGYGREPAGIDVPFRYDEISTPSITHRFDLLVADPAKPWLPKQAGNSSPDSNPCHPYDCLDPSVGTIDSQSGDVKAGSGAQPRTFAIAQLSQDEDTAVYPLVFEPRASYRPQPLSAPPAPVVPPPSAPQAPPIPTTPQVNLPGAPVLPLLAVQSPPPPPAPPAPPTFASQTPLDPSISPATLDVLPPAAVTQPPTPPVNPAPPSGARREARQRQAAAQKSGMESGKSGVGLTEGGEETQGAGGDSVNGPVSPHGAEMTRHDRLRPDASFTPLAHSDQPSAWARDALIGGGLGIAALVLAIGLGTARPTPRRRPPEAPAPAWSRTQTRR